MKTGKKKFKGSAQLQSCYASEELIALRRNIGFGKLNGQTAAAMEHLKICHVCRESFFESGAFDAERISTEPVFDRRSKEKELAQSHNRERFRRRPRSAPASLLAGQIWTTSTEIRIDTEETVGSVPWAYPVLIVAVEGDEYGLATILRVLPLTDTVDYVHPSECYILKEDNPLGYAATVEIFNEQPMLAGNLGRFVGVLASDDLKKVLSLRATFSAGKGAGGPPDYRAWKRKEIELAAYLREPVNAAICVEAPAIEIMPYRLAGDDGIRLDEIHPSLLLETEIFTASSIQKRDVLLLRIVCRKGRPQKIMIGGKRPKALRSRHPGAYDWEIGNVGNLPEVLEISFQVGRKHYRFKRPIVGRDQENS
jgi:hypothetical protein